MTKPANRRRKPLPLGWSPAPYGNGYRLHNSHPNLIHAELSPGYAGEYYLYVYMRDTLQHWPFNVHDYNKFAEAAGVSRLETLTPPRNENKRNALLEEVRAVASAIAEEYTSQVPSMMRVFTVAAALPILGPWNEVAEVEHVHVLGDAYKILRLLNEMHDTYYRNNPYESAAPENLGTEVDPSITWVDPTTGEPLDIPENALYVPYAHVAGDYLHGGSEIQFAVSSEVYTEHGPDVWGTAPEKVHGLKVYDPYHAANLEGYINALMEDAGKRLEGFHVSLRGAGVCSPESAPDFWEKVEPIINYMS